MMPKPRVYTEQEKDVALIFFQRLGDIKEAAKKAKVDEKSLAFWVAGGDEQKALEATAAATKSEVSPTIIRQLGQPSLDAATDIQRVNFEGNADPYILAQRAKYEEKRLDLILADGRVLPPVQMADPLRTPILVAPDLNLGDWVTRTFIGTEDEPEGPITNPDHAHLVGCNIGFLWTNVLNMRKGMQAIGTAELVGRLGDNWQTAEYHYHLMRWFGELPTFVIRLDAVWCAEADAASFAALVEHELYHCSIKMDADGNPKMDRYGNYSYFIRGHDVEQFIGVVRRYGKRAAGENVVAMVDAANSRPEISEAEIESVCCGCGGRI